MSKEYPLYPELTEEGKLEAQRIMDSFKPRIKSLIEELMRDLYTDVVYYVESDSWTNYRNDLINGFRDYAQNSEKNKCEFKELRKAIYNNNKEEIDRDLNADLVKEVEDLKKTIERLQEQRNY